MNSTRTFFAVKALRSRIEKLEAFIGEHGGREVYVIKGVGSKILHYTSLPSWAKDDPTLVITKEFVRTK